MRNQQECPHCGYVWEEGYDALRVCPLCREKLNKKPSPRNTKSWIKTVPSEPVKK